MESLNQGAAHDHDRSRVKKPEDFNRSMFKLAQNSISLTINNCYLIAKTARKNKQLANMAVVQLTEGAGVVYTANTVHYSKVFPYLHLLQILRSAFYNAFHNSVLSSVLD